MADETIRNFTLLDDSDIMSCIKVWTMSEDKVAICGMEEHTHAEGCYAEVGLICQLEEHTHSEACLVERQIEKAEQVTRYCGLEEHAHEETCNLFAKAAKEGN